MHATFVTLWLQVVQPLANVHETKWTPHVKRESDVAQSYNGSAVIPPVIVELMCKVFARLRHCGRIYCNVTLQREAR